MCFFSDHLLLSINLFENSITFRAFGWTPPQFGHLPLIMNSDGTKLSKRQDDIRVDHYRKDGIFPLALVNYITAAGGGFSRDKGLSHCYSYQELIQQVVLTILHCMDN